MLYEHFHAYPLIAVDGSKHPDDVDFGWEIQAAIGRRHLVVEVADNHSQTWLDTSGNFHSDALHVVERYMRTGPYHPVTKPPWTTQKSLRGRGRLACQSIAARKLLEYDCYAYDEVSKKGTFDHP
jgi:hypothetical protein